MKLCELLDIVWPNRVALHLGEVSDQRFTPLQYIENNVYDTAEANNYFPAFAIHDIYAENDCVVIVLTKQATITTICQNWQEWK